MILKAYSKLCTWIYQVMIAVCIVLMVVLIAASGLQVFSRYVLNSTLSWTDECARYCFMWMNLIGAGCLIRSQGHAVVDLFSAKLSGKVNKIYSLIIHMLILYMGAILTYHGWALCRITMRQTSTALKLPIGIVYGALPILGVLVLVYQIEVICNILVGCSDGKEEA